MSRNIVVRGMKPLTGEIITQGAKNAALPLLAASLMTSEKVILNNCPTIKDVKNMQLILEELGCNCKYEDKRVEIDSSHCDKWMMPESLGQRLRSSFFMLGPVLGRFKKALFTYPGGCAIGNRPIDLHLKGLRAMNANIVEEAGFIQCEANNLKGAKILLDYPSVGATENIMMAAVYADGDTVIDNAAQEPEIVELQRFLNSMGAKILGAGSRQIMISGVDELKGIEYTVMPDRIEAGTYLAAAAITGGEINVKQCCPLHLGPVIAKLADMGCEMDHGKDNIHLKVRKPLVAAGRIDTMPYPGFPTDLQAPLCAVATLGRGVTVVTENVFDNRFKHLHQLSKMGAKITVRQHTAIIEGVNYLHSAKVHAEDLRGGAALVLAGLSADGESTITGLEHIERGYEHMVDKMKSLGADIRVV